MIGAAMTAKEWGNVMVHAGNAVLTFDLGGAFPVMLPKEHYHRVAALCLYEQPFGFTQQDVLLLRQLKRYVGVARVSHGEPDPDALETIAAKIAALLPYASITIEIVEADRPE